MKKSINIINNFCEHSNLESLNLTGLIRFIFLLVILFLSQSFVLRAEKKDCCNITLSGRVIDSDINAPLEFASIYIKELKRGIISNDSGFYQISSLCAGVYTLECSHIG